MPTNGQQQENTDIKIAIIQTDLAYIKAKIDGVDKKVDLLGTQYVSRAEFEPIKRIVYGLVSLILIAVIVAILNVVLQK